MTRELVTWFNDVDATYRADLRALNELNSSSSSDRLRCGRPPPASL